MQPKLKKVLAFVLCFLLCFEQSGFAQVAGQLDISGHLASLRNAFAPDVFRPLHLRYLSYDNLNNNFRLLLDKGSLRNPKSQEVERTTKELLNYFFIGITLPNDAFWVNLRPDAESNIIDDQLAQTDVGKILLESDLQLKKDTARFTSPETPEGKEYWDKLYQKAEEIFGSENITIPTLTRPWIVPDEIIIRETTDSAYIYKATLKVMLEQDYLKDSAVYNFKDDRLKELNEYSSQLIREIIIPKLTKEVNSSKRYASLRQVYYSLIMAQWFKARFYDKSGLYSRIINRRILTGMTSKEYWSKTTYFQAYQKSFKDGEYNIQEPVYSAYGQTIRSYFSGGEVFNLRMPKFGALAYNRETDSTITSVPTASSPVANPNVVGIQVKATDEVGEVNEVRMEGSSSPINDSSRSPQDETGVGVRGQKKIVRNTIIAGITAFLIAAGSFIGLQLHKGSYKEPTRQEITIDFNKQKISPRALSELAIDASTNPSALRELIQLIPTLEEIIRSQPRNQEEKAIRITALDVLYMLISNPDSFAFRYDTLSIIHAFERLSNTLVELAREGYVAYDSGWRPYSHLEWFAQNGYDFAINALIDAHNSASKGSVWHKTTALHLHNLLYRSSIKRDRLLGLLTSDVNLQKQLNNILSTKESSDRKEFIKQHPNFGYFVLYHLRENRGFLDGIRQDESLPLELRTYALGLTCVLLDQDSAEVNKIIERENWHKIAAEFFKNTLPQKMEDIWREDPILTIEPKLQTYLVAYTLLLNPEPLVFKQSEANLASFRLAASFRLQAYLARADASGVMGLSILDNPYFVFWTFGHEAMHGLLDKSIFPYQTFNNDQIRIIHEFLSDIYGYKSLRIIVEDKRLFNEAAKKKADALGYEDSLSEWEQRNNEKGLDNYHAAARAVIMKIIRSNPQGVDWQRLFEISIEATMQMKEGFLKNDDPDSFIKFSSEIEERYNNERNHEQLRNQIKSLEREEHPTNSGASDQRNNAVGNTSGSASSPSTPEMDRNLGGIDFRHLPIVIQAIGNLSANIGSSTINRFSSINLNIEWQEIERMSNSGIIPSAERIKEYVQASCFKGNVAQDINKVILCISDILRLEEERYSPTDPLLRDILVMLESVRQTQELTQVFLGKTVF